MKITDREIVVQVTDDGCGKDEERKDNDNNKSLWDTSEKFIQYITGDIFAYR